MYSYSFSPLATLASAIHIGLTIPSSRKRKIELKFPTLQKIKQPSQKCCSSIELLC